MCECTNASSINRNDKTSLKLGSSKRKPTKVIANVNVGNISYSFCSISRTINVSSISTLFFFSSYVFMYHSCILSIIQCEKHVFGT